MISCILLNCDIFVFKFLCNKTCLKPDVFMKSDALSYDNGIKCAASLIPSFSLIYPTTGSYYYYLCSTDKAIKA